MANGGEQSTMQYQNQSGIFKAVISFRVLFSIYEFHHLKLEELVFAANVDVGVAI
jgi:hypothetical protein